MLKETKGVSLMVSYVLLISIAIALSISVYAWLRYEANVEPLPDCEDDTSMIILDHDCTGNKLQLTLKNNGFFTIDGFIIQTGNNTERLPIDRLSPFPGEGGAGSGAGYYVFKSEFGPGNTTVTNFTMELNRDVRVIHIQPFLLSERGEKVICTKALIKEHFSDCYYT